MSLVAFRAANHPQQVDLRGASDDIDDRAVPMEWFREIEARFGPFTVDAAASALNAKLPRYWTATSNGLQQSWAGESIYVNPPFSDMASWVRKAHESRDARVLMVAPANRTEQGWWQDYVEPYRDNGGRLRTHFLRKRRAFLKPGELVVPPNSRPPFGIVLLHWERMHTL